jgi:hypothetical protein
MHKLFDLGFIIGLFFAVIGGLLLGYSFLAHEIQPGNINRWCGIAFIVFAIVMLLLSRNNKHTPPEN